MKYVRKYAELARMGQMEYGVPASISLAQGIFESNCGESVLTRLTDNHFGVKCLRKECRRIKGNTHCMNFKDDTPFDRFRIYQDDKQSWEAHAKMLSKGRYEWLTECGIDYRTWAHGLEDSGYATDKQYAEKLIRLIKDYRLDEYDKIVP